MAYIRVLNPPYSGKTRSTKGGSFSVKDAYATLIKLLGIYNHKGFGNKLWKEKIHERQFFFL